MRIQIASDLHLEAIPTAPSIEFRRHLESGALRVVERSARRPLPLPEAFEPVLDSRIFGCLMPGMALARSGRFETRKGYGALRVAFGVAGSGTSTLAREMRA